MNGKQGMRKNLLPCGREWLHLTTALIIVMPLIIVGIGIALLLLLISKWKFNAFLALLFTSFAVGLLSGMNLNDILDSILKGIGDTMSKVLLILALGAMLGKILEESGAAHAISLKLIDKMGLQNIQYALLITGFLVGLPMMYNASFLVLVPLIFTFGYISGLPVLWLALPLCSALSVTHCFLPPHPAPTYVSFLYNADVNKVLLYGLVPAIPACLFGGIWLTRFSGRIQTEGPSTLFKPRTFEKSELPGLGISVLCAITPVILMLLGALSDIALGVPPGKEEMVRQGISLSGYYATQLQPLGLSDAWIYPLSRLITFFKWMSDANMALLSALILSLFTIGIRKGGNMEEVMKYAGNSFGPVSMILLIIAGGGAFSQVLKDSQVIGYIRTASADLHIHPLFMAFLVASLFRLAVGSATVATLTTAPIMFPIMQQSHTSPELMVLATGAGSVMWSHFNDSGFWMFKEYFGLTVRQTFQTWTVMESAIGLTGIVTVLLMSLFIS
ncbi:MAG: hypothetical protein LWW85_10620 [Marinilabiliales bacterium]|nr:hypothetical protein [Marinilabiliales bacterium]